VISPRLWRESGEGRIFSKNIWHLNLAPSSLIFSFSFDVESSPPPPFVAPTYAMQTLFSKGRSQGGAATLNLHPNGSDSQDHPQRPASSSRKVAGVRKTWVIWLVSLFVFVVLSVCPAGSLLGQVKGKREGCVVEGDGHGNLNANALS
jgi:hypothetical protein